MDSLLFQNACDKVIDQVKEENGIGTLGEKTIHAVLKNYFAPNPKDHEIKIDRYYADIVTAQSIIEIQTRNFNTLRKKLDIFLEIMPVTIVYPIPHKKWLRWINEETGEISSPRKSPKTGTPYKIFPELYRIKDYLLHPNLIIHIVLMDIEEYRYLNGWSKDKKKGASRSDGIPIKLIDEIILHTPEDYKNLVPDILTEPFTSKEFQKACKTSQKISQTSLNILHHLGALKRVGKIGNSYLYQSLL